MNIEVTPDRRRCLLTVSKDELCDLLGAVWARVWQLPGATPFLRQCHQRFQRALTCMSAPPLGGPRTPASGSPAVQGQLPWPDGTTNQ